MSSAAAVWKPAYLIHGDDHGRVTERRAGLRARAEAETGDVEILEGDAATPESVANALNAMTFATGRRFVVVDGVERWKDADVEPVVAVLANMPPETTVAFFGRDEGRAKVPAALAKAVTAAGGVAKAETAVKAKGLPDWLQGEAQRLGIELERPAAHRLVAEVGERQQRLLRELEKLVLCYGTGVRLSEDHVVALAAPSAETQVWGLVDALAAGDRRRATAEFLHLRDQGESLPRMVPLVARRLREVLGLCERLEAGETPAQLKASFKGSPWTADRRIKEARSADRQRLRDALEALADLEIDTRGASPLHEDTDALRAIARIAG